MRLKYQLNHFLWKAVDWVYPPSCAGCEAPGYRFCPTCEESTLLVRNSFCAVCQTDFPLHSHQCSVCEKNQIHGVMCYSWGVYENQIREAIHSLKYDRNIGLGDYFSVRLNNLLSEINLNFDLVVPIPLSKNRYKLRGYNQSETISRSIAYYFGIPHSSNAISRVKETEAQFNLPHMERIVNMKDAFFGNSAKLKGRKVLVVDDIITTGTTITEATKAIIEAGGKVVYGVSIARAGKLISENIVKST